MADSSYATCLWAKPFRFSSCPAPAARVSRHKSSHPKRQRAPLRMTRLMLVASGRAASAFLCPAPGLRGPCHKSNRPRRQKTPSWPIRLMPPASGQSPSAFLCPAPGLRGPCHKSNRPRRQKTPSWPIRLMPPASGQSPSAFLFTSLFHTVLAAGFLRLVLLRRCEASMDL
jgi:hypothetical protein